MKTLTEFLKEALNVLQNDIESKTLTLQEAVDAYTYSCELVFEVTDLIGRTFCQHLMKFVKLLKR